MSLTQKEPETCDNPIINRLEYPMANVEVELVNGDFQPTGHTEILDAPWKETESYWCVSCDTELDSKEKAIEHLKTGLPMKENHPTLDDFYNDMNEHNARYGFVEPDHVLELERFNPRKSDGWFNLTVWQAVERKDGEGYVTPDQDENNYHWDAVARAKITDPGEAQRTFWQLKGHTDNPLDLAAWIEANPYDGPRTPYYERDDTVEPA